MVLLWASKVGMHDLKVDSLRHPERHPIQNSTGSAAMAADPVESPKPSLEEELSIGPERPWGRNRGAPKLGNTTLW